jgi:hypothetical protein
MSQEYTDISTLNLIGADAIKIIISRMETLTAVRFLRICKPFYEYTKTNTDIRGRIESYRNPIYPGGTEMVPEEYIPISEQEKRIARFMNACIRDEPNTAAWFFPNVPGLTEEHNKEYVYQGLIHAAKHKSFKVIAYLLKICPLKDHKMDQFEAALALIETEEKKLVRRARNYLGSYLCLYAAYAASKNDNQFDDYVDYLQRQTWDKHWNECKNLSTKLAAKGGNYEALIKIYHTLDLNQREQWMGNVIRMLISNNHIKNVYDFAMGYTSELVRAAVELKAMEIIRNKNFMDRTLYGIALEHAVECNQEEIACFIEDEEPESIRLAYAQSLYNGRPFDIKKRKMEMEKRRKAVHENPEVQSSYGSNHKRKFSEEVEDK